MAKGLLRSNKTRDGIAASLAENIAYLEEDMYNVQQEWDEEKETFSAMEDALEQAGLRVLNKPNLIKNNWWTTNSALSRKVVYGQDSRIGGTTYPYLKSYNQPTEYTQTTEPTSAELAECCAYYTSTTDGVTTYHLFKDEDDIKATVADLASADQITELDGEVYAQAIQYAITANTAYGNSEWLMYYNYQTNKYTEGGTCKDYGQLTDLEVGQMYTISCWGRVTSGDKAWIRFAWGGNGYNYPYAQEGKCVLSDFIEVSGSTWARYSWTFTFNPTGDWYTETSETADGVTTVKRSYNWNKRVSIGVSRKFTSTIQLTGFRLVKGRMWICETYDDLSDALEETQTRASAAEATVEAVQANVQAAICETDSDTATANHAVGDVFWMDGVLYKTTVAIATGETITPGTNCETTTVEAELALRADKTDTVLETTLSRGRATNSSTGDGSFAFGNNVTASSPYSHAEGYQTTASAHSAHAEGYITTASGSSSHAEGRNNNAYGLDSHAEGSRTTANGKQSHTEGYQTSTGLGTIACHAEGHGTEAGQYDEDYASDMKGCHAEGEGTRAIGIHGSHAEGNHTIASGGGAHAEGGVTEASGTYSHAEGFRTIASGSNAHAEGRWTIANHLSQHVFGEYNVEDGSTKSELLRGNYVEIVGKGTAENDRSNARTLDWDGNEKIAGSLTLGLGTADEVTITPAQLTALLALLS